MRIGINASFLRKRDSGTGQVTAHFLGSLFAAIKQGIDGFGEHDYIIYTEEEHQMQLPERVESKAFLPVYKRDDLVRKVIWEKKLLPKKVYHDNCDVFYSLYQCPTVLKGVRHLMLVHDAVWKVFPEYLNNSRKRSYYRKVDKAIKKADHIMTVSEHSKRDIMKFFKLPEEKITVNYIDCDPIFKQDYTEHYAREVMGKHNLSSGFIFYVGGFDVRKNVSNLIESYGMLWSQYHGRVEIPDLVLGGEFYPQLIPLVTDIPSRIKEVEKKYGVPAQKIKYLGFIDQKELPVFYREANFFCYPSLYEGFGLPVLEAMNSGCAVIASKTSSLPEVAGENSALLVDPGDEQQLMAAMQSFLANPAVKQQYIENAKARARQFNWSKFLATSYNAINEITQ